MAVGDAGGVAPVQIYTSYEVAVAAAGQVSVAVVCVAIVVPLAGDVLVTQAGTGMAAVVNVVVLAAAQVVAAPVAFLGAIYQLYKVDAVRPVAL